jgi:hypothetical protein
MIVQVEWNRVILKSETHAERCQLSFVSEARIVNKAIEFHWEDMEAVMIIQNPEENKEIVK